MLVEQRQEIAALSAAVDAQQDELKTCGGARALERQDLRDHAGPRRLYYVMPGEVSFLVINDLAAPLEETEQAPISTEIQNTQLDWLQSMFASVMTAGLAESTATP